MEPPSNFWKGKFTRSLGVSSTHGCDEHGGAIGTAYEKIEVFQKQMMMTVMDTGPWEEDVVMKYRNKWLWLR